MGCATTPAPNKYAGAYDEAVSAGKSVVIIKEGDLETLKDGIEGQLTSVGYNKEEYTSAKDGFMVLVKDSNFGSPLLAGDKHPCRMILKYTNIGEGKTRIDLVNGSTDPSTKDEIDRDIQKLADLIRNNGGD
jgi:hypothetical protein